jgi:Protein of unknown function (DUF2530)
VPNVTDQGEGDVRGTAERSDARQQVLPPPPPLPRRLVDLRPVTWVGTAVWFVAFCVLLVTRLAFHAGEPIVLWTCLAGWVLGLIGLVIVRKHRAEGRTK